MSPLLQWAAQGLYNVFWWLAWPLALARLGWRGRLEPQYGRGWAQRLGHWPDPPVPLAAAGPRVWVHAVSLGETRAAIGLIQALRARLPGMQLLLTAGTATGWQAGLEALREGDLHGWVPLDTPGAARRFLVATRPSLGVLVETETWPNLLGQARVLGVPMVLANARLSQASLRKGLRWAVLSRPMMAGLAAALAQTQQDAQRLAQAGVDARRVHVMGNLKYDARPDAALIERGRGWRRTAAPAAAGRRLVMAASWRETEDEPLCAAWARRLATLGAAGQTPPPQRPLLVVVPRHPQRFEEVCAILQRAGLTTSRRSQWGPDGPDELAWQADAWLGDTVGEMPAYYGACDVALLGGSFAPLGGQNLIEAAACGCPMVVGPHTFNFDDAAQRSIAAGAALRASSLEQAVDRALGLSASELQQQRAAGTGLIADHAGATQRTADFLAAMASAAHQR